METAWGMRRCVGGQSINDALFFSEHFTHVFKNSILAV
jgi:hypothetical protein